MLTGAGGIRAAPFFSPDGQWVGFFRGNLALQTVGVTGGPVTTVASLQGAFGRGATWGGNDTIIFATTGASGLQMVDANGELSVLTVPDTESGEADHLFPSYLPGEQAVLFTIAAAGGSSRGGVAVLDLTTETYKLLISGGSDARYLPTGHLVYVADNTLRAVPFDRARLEVANTASVPVVPGIATTDAGEGFFDISLEGTLAYSVDVGQRVRRTLVWLNRRGEEEPLGAPDRAYLYPRLSPDGSRVALDVRDEENDIWMWDIQSQTLSRFTTAPGLERFPVWATDGSRVFFTSDRLGTPNLFARVVDGGDNVERLSESSTDQAAMSTSPDGQGLVFREGGDLLKLSLGDEPQLEPLVVDPFFNGSATVSPDGRWLAYSSDESGQLEVYVRPWTGGGERRLVSMHGGRQPVWNPAGGELFFFGSTDELMGVEISPTTDEWRATTPTVVLRRGYAIGNRGAAATYDVSPDGERFLMIRSNASRDSTPSEIIVVQNWHEELKRLVPVD